MIRVGRDRRMDKARMNYNIGRIGLGSPFIAPNIPRMPETLQVFAVPLVTICGAHHGRAGKMVSHKSLCILLAEDHEDSLEVLARLLRLNGHTVYTARTAREARDLAAANRCDLLIGDIGLPERSGIELMRELHAQYGLKGIAVSGSAARQHAQAALEAGYARYLAKPVSFSDLLVAIDEVAR